MFTAYKVNVREITKIRVRLSIDPIQMLEFKENRLTQTRAYVKGKNGWESEERLNKIVEKTTMVAIEVTDSLLEGNYE